jgi:hypothetical protein
MAATLGCRAVYEVRDEMGAVKMENGEEDGKTFKGKG